MAEAAEVPRAVLGEHKGHRVRRVQEVALAVDAEARLHPRLLWV